MTAPGQTVLFVEDDDALRIATVQALELAGFAVRAYPGAAAALAAVTPGLDGVVVSDIRMPRMDGLQLLAAVRAIDADLPMILVTGHGDVPMAVAALKDGAFDFLTKPFAADHLAATVRRALDRRGLVMENRRLRAAAETDSPLIGASVAAERLRAAIRAVAQAGVDVLVEGEPGTGKDLVAGLLHRQGPRRSRPLVAFDCGASPEEAVELDLFGHAADSVPHTRLSRQGQAAAASGGTLVLDRIDRLPLRLQPRLLRLIEDREVVPLGAGRPETVDVRVIAMTTADPEEAVAAGRLRADLFYRLATARLHVPPLRRREDDRLLLFATFAQEAQRQLGRDDHAMRAAERDHLLAHDWPGNVRELRQYAYRSVLARHGPADEPAGPPDLRTRVARFETGLIVDALRATTGNVVRALDLLQIPRKTLYDKLSRYRIDPDDYRRRTDGGDGG